MFEVYILKKKKKNLKTHLTWMCEKACRVMGVEVRGQRSCLSFLAFSATAGAKKKVAQETSSPN